MIRTLGAGGMGVVYEAQDTRLPRSVAIKVLKDELTTDLDAIRRFKREARLTSSLNHPNICTVLDASENESLAFIAMELLQGVSLKARLLRGLPTLTEIVDIIRQVVDALGAAHDAGIIHRDIKPGNIFLTTSGLVKLLDFGLATHFATGSEGEASDDLTSAGTTVGTIHYMAPEQLAGGVVDHRCDFFALGVVLYQMAAGTRPFDHSSRHALTDAIRHQPHVPLRVLAPHHPVQLAEIVDRLLAKDPEKRYQSAATLRADLEALPAAHQGEVTTPEPAGGYSAVPDAYHAFKRGKHLWATCHEGGWRLALEQFQYAIDCDPEFARAHAALANAYNFLGFYSIVKPALAFGVAAQAAARAITINDRLGRAFIELGLAKLGGEWDWDGAEAAFRRGLALDPTDAMAHIHYSWLLMLLGRQDAAFAEAERGLALAPSSRLVAAGRAETFYLAGRYARALDACDECLRFDPDYVFAVHLRGLSHLAQGLGDNAVADLERAAELSRRAPFYLGLLGRCYAECGHRSKALAIIDELRALPPDTYVPSQCYVYVYAALGERARALEYQEMAYTDGASPFNYLTPGVRELYALSPDHKRRLEQMRLRL